MIHIQTIFDQNKPLISAVYDDKKESINFYVFYLPGTNISLYDIEETKKKFVSLFAQEMTINNFKNHLLAFDLKTNGFYNAYEIPCNDVRIGKTLNETKENLVAAIIERGKQHSAWNRILTEASTVYADLEKRGVYADAELVHPSYQYVSTGRSSTSGFNIQNATSDVDITHVFPEFDTFVHFDWSSADIRVASFLSEDPIMEGSFSFADPYTIVAQDTDESREDIKILLLSGIYSLDEDNPIIEYYFPKFGAWMGETITKIKETGYSESVLGRKFILTQDNMKSVFNATIQGTVAHAMQLALTRLHTAMPYNIVAEIHDSVVLACEERSIQDVISKATSILTRPFEGILEKNPFFPISINIGKQWRKWVPYQEIRAGELLNV